MTKSAVIIGAQGFLGSHIAEHLETSGFDVVKIGRTEMPALGAKLRHHRADLIIQAAGSASVENSVKNPHEDFHNSVVLTAEILDAVRRYSPEAHFVMLSSAAVYGAPDVLPISEDSPLAPISPYGFHKLMCELLVEEAKQGFQLSATILRIFSAYGERIKRQVVRDLCSKLLLTNTPEATLRGTGDETRDFIHAFDVARVVEHIATKRQLGVFNVASGRQTTISELANLIARSLGVENQLSFDGIIAAGVPRFWQADISKLRATGFDCAIPLETGLSAYCDWYQNQHGRSAETNLFTVSDSSVQSSLRSSLRIGFSSMSRWLGGVAYLDLLTKSIAELPRSERPSMTLVFNETDGLDLHGRIIERMDEVIFVGAAFRDIDATAFGPAPVRKVATLGQAIDLVDVYFPVNSYVIPKENAVSWIPDFQHLYLPELFSKADCDDRDRRYREIAEQAHHVVFSSQDAAKDFARYNAANRIRVHVMPFYALPEDACYAAAPAPIVAKYRLPQKFLICCNQFWQHKNHQTLFSAIKLLQDHGVHVPVVCTGALSDSRNPQYIQQIKQSIAEQGIGDLVYLMGELPRDEQLQLMRASLAVVQPSLFEGWSTVVEDARAFGKTIFLSDLAVHKEQAPRWAVYFDRNSATDLAEKIVGNAGDLRPGPDLQREKLAREDAVRFTAEFGRNFLSIARDVARAGQAPAVHIERQVDLSIILATKNRAKLLEQMLDSLPSATKGLRYELIVIEGGSEDGTRPLLKHRRDARVFDEQQELGAGKHSWPELYNFGFNRAQGTWGIFASDDITFESECFSRALRMLHRAPAHVGGGIFFYRNEVADNSWAEFGIDLLPRHVPLLNYGLIDVGLFQQLGGLSTDYRFYCADADLTWKIESAGKVLAPLPQCLVVHHNLLDTQKKTNLQTVETDLELYMQRWEHRGSREEVNPRRLLWEPTLARTFSPSLLALRSTEDVRKLWGSVALVQHGYLDEGLAGIESFAAKDIPTEVREELVRFVQALINHFQAATATQ